MENRSLKWSLAALAALLLHGAAVYAADVTYTYDNLNRLDTATYGDGRTFNYGYDYVGNRQISTETVTWDSDSDGMSDAIELPGCTDPDNADSDGDGITDGVEDLNHNGLLDSGESDPCNTDTDSDGIADGSEDANLNGWRDVGESDPRSGDTDGDGVGDESDFCPYSQPVRLASDSYVYHSSIQNAYENFVLSDDVIEVHAVELSEALNFHHAKSIVFKGGFDCNYCGNPGATVIHGAMTISSGTVTVEGVVLR